MTRLLSEHAGILYPSVPEELDRLLMPCQVDGDLPPLAQLRGLPAALIVSHASYRYCLPQLRQAFSSTLAIEPQLIVALAPLHRACLVEDSESGRSLFCPESTLWETPGGTITLDAPSIGMLDAALAAVLARRDCYFQEEYAIELLLPFCMRRFPTVPLLPLLADLHHEDGLQAARMALQHLSESNQKVLFILSSNPPSNCGNGWIQAIDRISNSKTWDVGVETPYISATKEWT